MTCGGKILMDRNKYRELLLTAYDYALENRTFSKVDIVNQAEEVIVFGLGKYFEDAFLKQRIKERFKVKYLCDNNKEKIDMLSKDEKYCDMLFVQPMDLQNMEKPVVIVMLGDPRSAIEQLAPIVGGGSVIAFNDLILDDIMDASKSIEYYQSERNNFISAFDLLEDDISRAVYFNVFCLRVAPHLAQYTYEELCSETQYFPNDIYRLSENETIVDCGAYVGDTLETFAKLVDGKFQSYYAFEMDKDNFCALKSAIAANGLLKDSNIYCYNAGVWNEDTILSYGKMSSDDSFSIFNGSKIEQTYAVKLDTILKDIEVTLIKMDIEGAEMNALRGAIETISRCTPKLALCVYHRVEDLWEIPIYIKSIVPLYKFYMRHHAKWWVSETVCYAL